MGYVSFKGTEVVTCMKLVYFPRHCRLWTSNYLIWSETDLPPWQENIQFPPMSSSTSGKTIRSDSKCMSQRVPCTLHCNIRAPWFKNVQKRNNYDFSVNSNSSSYAFIKSKGSSGLCFGFMFFTLQSNHLWVLSTSIIKRVGLPLASLCVNVILHLWAWPTAMACFPHKMMWRDLCFLCRWEEHCSQTPLQPASHCCYHFCLRPFYLCLIEYYISFSLYSATIYITAIHEDMNNWLPLVLAILFVDISGLLKGICGLCLLGHLGQKMLRSTWSESRKKNLSTPKRLPLVSSLENKMLRHNTTTTWNNNVMELVSRDSWKLFTCQILKSNAVIRNLYVIKNSSSEL